MFGQRVASPPAHSGIMSLAEAVSEVEEHGNLYRGMSKLRHAREPADSWTFPENVASQPP